MIPYLILFTIIVLLSTVIQREKASNKIKKIISASIILILSIFGGLRAPEVGTDIGVYGQKYFEQAKEADTFQHYISGKISASDEESKDYGYMALNYIIAKTTGSFATFLTVLQIITNAPIIIVFFKRRKECSFSICILMYLCLFYCRNFNMLRQGAAISLAFLASHYLQSEEKKIKPIILFILAYTMHSSAIIMIVAQTMLYFAKNIKNSTFKKISKYVFIASGVLVLFLGVAMPILYERGLITTRIYNYINVFKNDSGSLPLTDLIMFVSMAIPSIIDIVKRKEPTSQERCDNALAIEGMILYFVRMTMVYADRIALYFQYCSMTALPVHFRSLTPRKRQLAYIAMVGLLIIYWYVKHVVMGAHEVIPYRSII